MNPSLKFILILILSLAISIKMSLTANCTLIGLALCYLVAKRIPSKRLLVLLLSPLPAALTVFLTLNFFTDQPNTYVALNLSSRIYVYVSLIACLSLTTPASTFARSLEQNLHLPSKFAYGVLAALNLLPQMRDNILRIRAAGMMRGLYLSFWSPVLYFKAILLALNSAENLAWAMQTHGFKEGASRSTIIAIPLRQKDWLEFASLLIPALGLIVLFK